MRLRGELQREAGGEDTGEEIREDVQEDAMEVVSLDQYPLSLPELHVVDSESERRLSKFPEERGSEEALASACVTCKSPIEAWRSCFTYRTL